MMLSALVQDWRTQVFFPQRYNCTALKVMFLGEERILAQDVMDRSFTLCLQDTPQE